MAGTFQTGCGELFSHLFKNPKARLCSKSQLLELRVYPPAKLAEFPPLGWVGRAALPVGKVDVTPGRLDSVVHPAH